jgi:hypothetical protein
MAASASLGLGDRVDLLQNEARPKNAAKTQRPSPFVSTDPLPKSGTYLYLMRDGIE